MTLRARIAGVAGLAVAVAILAAAVFTYVAVRSSLRGEVDSALRDRADRFDRAVTRPNGRPRPPNAAARRIDRLRHRGGAGPGPIGGPGPHHRAGPLGPPPRDRLRPIPSESPFGGAEGYTQFVTRSGAVLEPPGAISSLPVQDRARQIARAGEGEYLTDMEVGDSHLRVLTRATGSNGAVQVARPLDEIDSQLGRLLVALAVLGAVGVALGAGLGALVARAALVPIARFTSRTEQLSAEGEPSQRMEVVGDDELARLARSFNATLDALESAVESQRHLVADASHELRTPIASLRANVQNLQDAERLPPEERERMRADIIEELDELTSLVGDVVELAKGAKPGEVQDDVRLDRLVEDLVLRTERRAGPDVEIRLSTQPTLIRGEPERLSRAVSNLLANAVKWSPRGGVVEVDLSDGVLTVRDHGPGFREEDLPHVFERFYRAPAARGMSGSGLGLAIVQQAAEAHGGFVEASNAPGGGALMRAGFGPRVEPEEAPEPARQA
jgi:two-component system, OmpR family, sensor histidine kinase MprB